MKSFLSFLIAVLILPVTASAQLRWDLNDVSILFPLPRESEPNASFLLGPAESGAKGELLPPALYQRIPTLLNNGNGNATLYKGALRVVALRVDPCPVPGNCQPELRLVWQPIEKDEDTGSWTSRDGALHSFYSLSRAEFEAFRGALLDLKMEAMARGVNTNSKPLGVHPAFQSEPTRAWFGNKLKSLLLANCGATNLQKVTFMSLLVPATWWRFGSFEPAASGTWELTTIPRLTATFEDIFNSAMEDGGVSGPGKEMDAIFNVLPNSYPEQDNLFAVINRGFRLNDDRDLPIFREKLDAVARFQNPHHTNPRNLDCASCHYADATRYYAGLRFDELKRHLSADEYQNPEPGTFNLANQSVGAAATRIIRAFGYFDASPALSQRVIHDSAETAHWLNSN